MKNQPKKNKIEIVLNDAQKSYYELLVSNRDQAQQQLNVQNERLGAFFIGLGADADKNYQVQKTEKGLNLIEK